MTSVIFRPEAEEDLTSIALYVLEWNGEERAAALSRRLRARVKILRAHPYAGRMRADIGEDIRGLVEKPHVLLYRRVGTTAEVVAVLHGARDVEAVVRRRLSPPE